MFVLIAKRDIYYLTINVVRLYQIVPHIMMIVHAPDVRANIYHQVENAVRLFRIVQRTTAVADVRDVVEIMNYLMVNAVKKLQAVLHIMQIVVVAVVQV